MTARPRGATGSANGRWNPDRIVTSHGYVLLRVGRGHPHADTRGMMYEHLSTWLSAGRRAPRADETLHHRNGNRQDNRLSNLQLLTRSAHARHHAETRTRRKNGTFAKETRRAA